MKKEEEGRGKHGGGGMGEKLFMIDESNVPYSQISERLMSLTKLSQKERDLLYNGLK